MASSAVCARCSSATGAYELVYGGEAVLAGGAVVGRVRSAAYGYTVGQMIASAYLPRELAPDTPLAVEALGAQVPAEIAERRALRRRERARAFVTRIKWEETA